MQPRKLKRTLIAALLVPPLATAGAVLAQQAPQTGPQAPQQAQTQAAQMPIQLSERDKRASRLIGMDVRSPQDEKLGKIRDLVINTNTGNVEYVALAHGGFLGLGQDLYAYPLDRFQLAPERNQATLDVTREQLQQGQGFDQGDWPKVRADRGFWDRITANFGRDRPASGATAPQAAQEQPVQFVRASEIEGEQLRDRQGGNLGEIEDLIVSMEQGEVRYAVVDTEGDDRMVAVSMKDVQVRRDNGKHIVEYTQDKLDLSKSFSEAQWRELDRGPRAAAGGTLDPATPGGAPASR